MLGLVRVSNLIVLKDCFLHNKLNIGDKTSALGYYGVKSKGKISGGSKSKY
jgi:hypothetical protein